MRKVVPLDGRQRDLASRYAPLALALARRFARDCPGLRDDFASDALMALVYSARSFDPSRGIRFATHARRRIEGELIDAMRASYARAVPVPLGRRQLAAASPGVGARAEAAEEADRWLGQLPVRAAEVCRRYYLGGRTQREVADDLGISQSEVNRLLRRSIDCLASLAG